MIRMRTVIGTKVGMGRRRVSKKFRLDSINFFQKELCVYLERGPDLKIKRMTFVTYHSQDVVRPVENERAKIGDKMCNFAAAFS